MDEIEKKEKVNFIGNYHPHPKEALKYWRMVRMQELRKEVLKEKRKQKEKKPMDYLTDRAKEISSWSGASLIVLGAWLHKKYLRRN
jgi:hypothetical protein|tara:strand:- start:797 stop:1054 length:258 start_codon:yes stop_codon:yes gene_type:complete